MRKARSLQRSQRGVIEMPLELTIIVLILAIMLPIIYAAALYYDSEQQQVQARTTLDKVSSSVTQAFAGDVGTRIVLSVSGQATGYLLLGGPLFAGCTVTGIDGEAYFVNALAGGVTYNATVDSGTGPIPISNLSSGGSCPHWQGRWVGYTLTSSSTLSFTKCWALAGSGSSAGEYSCSALPPSPAPSGTSLVYFVEVASF